MKPGVEVESFSTIVLAGGGNRCWWQAGVLSQWLAQDRVRARRFAGTSAGAGVACATLGGTLEAAVAACQRLYGANHANYNEAQRAFAHETIYPQWVQSFMTPAALARLATPPLEMLVGVARLPRHLPPVLGIGLGMLAYLADKFVISSIHPRLPGWFGYRAELHALHHLNDATQAQGLLVAAAAAPPFMAPRELNGRLAVDGGLCDNAPRPPFAAPAERQLVLLTRHYPQRPSVFEHQGRWYMQPSRPVPVSTWDCTLRTDISHAIELGRVDAAC